MIKAIGFDMGHTLMKNNHPLSWSSLYPSAIAATAQKCDIELTENMVSLATDVLTKYNTRINYRENEVSSDTIFNEILSLWNCPNKDIQSVKSAFYSFFQADTLPFPETIETLAELKRNGLQIGVLTDVAYGMDNAFSLKEFAILSEYIDIVLTSVDVGYRKPNKTGFMRLLDFFHVSADEMIYVGDEDKDIKGANNVGIVSVLINRNDEVKEYSQNYTINSLNDIFSIIFARK